VHFVTALQVLLVLTVGQNLTSARVRHVSIWQLAPMALRIFHAGVCPDISARSAMWIMTSVHLTRANMVESVMENSMLIPVVAHVSGLVKIATTNHTLALKMKTIAIRCIPLAHIFLKIRIFAAVTGAMTQSTKDKSASRSMSASPNRAKMVAFAATSWRHMFARALVATSGSSVVWISTSASRGHASTGLTVWMVLLATGVIAPMAMQVKTVLKM
jgi:hypothetical protein